MFLRPVLRTICGLLLLCFGASAQSETVLILPFFNLSKTKNLDWIGDSISETLIEALSSEGVDVVENDQRDRALGEAGVRRNAVLTQASVAEVALTMSAGIAVSGEYDVFTASGGAKQIRIKARVIEVRRVRHGPEFDAGGALDLLSSLQNKLAWQALRAISTSSTATEASFAQAHPAIRLDALESYVRGLLADAPDQKLKLFSAAVRLEPTYGQAQFQLGLALFGRREYRSAAEAMGRVPPGSPRGRAALFHMGLARYYQGDFVASVKALRTLSEQVPMGEVFNNLGAAMSRAGEEGAVSAFEKAVETDPSDPEYYFNLGYALWRAGRFDEAAVNLRQSLERRTEDDLATLILGRCLQKVGPRPGDLRTEAAERLKTSYNEAAFLALKTMLRGKEKE